MGVGVKNSVGVSKGMITNIDQTVEAVRKAVEEAEHSSEEYKARFFASEADAEKWLV